MIDNLFGNPQIKARHFTKRKKNAELINVLEQIPGAFWQKRYFEWKQIR